MLDHPGIVEAATRSTYRDGLAYHWRRYCVAAAGEEGEGQDGQDEFFHCCLMRAAAAGVALVVSVMILARIVMCARHGLVRGDVFVVLAAPLGGEKGSTSRTFA